MAVVVVDDKGRITLPKRLREGAKKVVLIPAGSHIVLIPVRGDPEKLAEGWLETKRGRRELKELAEREAKKNSSKKNFRDFMEVHKRPLRLQEMLT